MWVQVQAALFVSSLPVHIPCHTGDYVLAIGGAGVPTLDVWLLNGTSIADNRVLPCPFLLDIRLLHGLLMLLSWGILLPIGVTIARFARR